MKKTTHYFVRVKGECGQFSPNALTYGPRQCREHIKQLRKHRHDGRKPYAKTEFEIVRKVTVETVIGKSKP